MSTKNNKSKEIIHYFCENCNKECFEKYGSGRFCSIKCAKSYSTKEKRNEINNKVSKKLKKYKFKKLYVKKCSGCGNIYFTTSQSKIYCSTHCSHKYAQLGKHKKHGKDRKKGSGGYRHKGGKSKVFKYINWLGYEMYLNKDEIKVAKILDERKIQWTRNTTGFKYITVDNKERKYYPDFKILNK